jgi:uncharacterized protein
MVDVNFLQLLFRLLLLVGGCFLVPKIQQRALKTVLFQPIGLRHCLKIMILFFGILLVGVLGFSVLEAFFRVPLVENPQAVAVVTLLQIITVIVLAPIVEETWFRHWVLSQPASEKRPPWLGFIEGWGDIISVVVFGLLHFSPDYWGVKAFFWALLMGLFLLWVRRTTGSLSFCIALHALHNSLLVFF